MLYAINAFNQKQSILSCKRKLENDQCQVIANRFLLSVFRLSSSSCSCSSLLLLQEPYSPCALATFLGTYRLTWIPNQYVISDRLKTLLQRNVLGKITLAGLSLPWKKKTMCSDQLLYASDVLPPVTDSGVFNMFLPVVTRSSTMGIKSRFNTLSVALEISTACVNIGDL